MVTSIEAIKAFDKIQYPFLTENSTRGVQPVARRLQAAQMAMNVAQHKILNLLKTS